MKLSARSAWRIQRGVIYALFLREIRSRFGKFRLGYLWAVMQPMIHIMFMALIFGHASKSKLPGIDYLVVLISGFVPWFFFSQVISRCQGAVEANRGLFSYRQVKPVDAILARIQVELVTYSALMIILLGGCLLFGVDAGMHDPLGVLFSYSLFIVLSTALGMIVCIGSTFSLEVAKFIPFLMRPLYFMSGLFFPLSVVPPDMRVYFTWNPILHFMELSRGHWFASYPSVITDYSYFAQITLGITFFALLLYKRFRIRLLTTV